jgi:protein TonB
MFAVMLHGGVILFGGALLPGQEKQSQRTTREVELAAPEEAADKKKDQIAQKTTEDEMKSDKETPPDASEVMRSIEVSAASAAPELAALSLSSIESALNGQGGRGGDFGQGGSLVGGGVIGGQGSRGSSLDDKTEKAFSLAEIDQKPRPISQTAPAYPAEMRGKKIEGIVTILFVVDPSGRVVNQRVEKASHDAFKEPALDAVKQWKFDPAVRGGQRVSCKMRVPIRFERS